jgi:hypothetical protein
MTTTTAPRSKPLHTRASIQIDRPVDTVWAAVTDYATDARWRKGITEMTPDIAGPPRVGTNVREVLHLGGRDYVTDTTVTHVGPGRRYRFAGSGTSGQVRGGRHVLPGATPDSAVFTYDVVLEPTNVPRVARRVLTWWLGHSLRRDVRRLRALLEATS